MAYCCTDACAAGHFEAIGGARPPPLVAAAQRWSRNDTDAVPAGSHPVSDDHGRGVRGTAVAEELQAAADGLQVHGAEAIFVAGPDDGFRKRGECRHDGEGRCRPQICRWPAEPVNDAAGRRPLTLDDKDGVETIEHDLVARTRTVRQRFREEGLPVLDGHAHGTLKHVARVHAHRVGDGDRLCVRIDNRDLGGTRFEQYDVVRRDQLHHEGLGDFDLVVIRHPNHHVSRPRARSERDGAIGDCHEVKIAGRRSRHGPVTHIQSRGRRRGQLDPQAHAPAGLCDLNAVFRESRFDQRDLRESSHADDSRSSGRVHDFRQHEITFLGAGQRNVECIARGDFATLRRQRRPTLRGLPPSRRRDGERHVGVGHRALVQP